MNTIQEIKYQQGRIQKNRELATRTQGWTFRDVWSDPYVTSAPSGERRIHAKLLWHRIKVARMVIESLPPKPYRRAESGGIETCFVWDSGGSHRPLEAKVVWERYPRKSSPLPLP